MQSELEDRRDELKGLDLAIERQKQSLRGMKDPERRLLKQRQAARDELLALKQGRDSSRRRRRAYLDSGGFSADVDVFDSDFDYEYSPYTDSSRREYIRKEINCLEKTLAKRLVGSVNGGFLTALKSRNLIFDVIFFYAVCFVNYMYMYIALHSLAILNCPAPS